MLFYDPVYVPLACISRWICRIYPVDVEMFNDICQCIHQNTIKQHSGINSKTYKQFDLVEKFDAYCKSYYNCICSHKLWDIIPKIKNLV